MIFIREYVGENVMYEYKNFLSQYKILISIKEEKEENSLITLPHTVQMNLTWGVDKP